MSVVPSRLVPDHTSLATMAPCSFVEILASMPVKCHKSSLLFAILVAIQTINRHSALTKGLVPVLSLALTNSVLTIAFQVVPKAVNSETPAATFATNAL